MVVQTLSRFDEQQLIENMSAYIDTVREQIPGMYGTVKILSHGKPLVPQRLAAELQLGPEELKRIFRIGEKDEDGNLVGFGLSLVPTPHRYQVGDRKMYAWCAADAIMFSIFLKSDALVESRDPISGEEIRLTATPAGVQRLDPSTAVISHPAEGDEFEHVRAQLCNVTHFFASTETAQKYVEKHPGLLIIPVEQGFKIWSRVYDREPYKSMIAEL
ncbi:MAG: organomercurial lyase [Anaerolineales bacterium]